MAPKLMISNAVLRRLVERKSPFLGELYGLLHDNSLIIISFTLRYIEELNECKYQISENNFPTDIDLYGVVSCDKDLSKFEGGLPQEIKTICTDVVVTDNPVILTYGYLAGENNIRAYFYKNGVALPVDYEVISEEDIWKQFVLVHLNVPISISCYDQPKDKEDFILTFTKKVSSGMAMFHIQGSEIYLTSADAEGMSNGDSASNILCNEEEQDNSLTDYICKKMGKSNCASPLIINVDVFMKKTISKVNDNLKPAPTIQQNSGNFECIIGCLNLSSLIMFQKNRNEKHLYNALVDSVCRILKLTKRSFFINDSIAPQIYHFYPSHLSHFISLVYPRNIDDDNLRDVRKFVHSKFNLPYDQPYFRRINSQKFKDEKVEIQQLANVHIGLAPSGVNGNISLVQGDYLYFHYLQDNFNDNGWGCAYRSLQTLFSWYKLQGWSDRDVPSLTEIQQVLVDIEDKPKSFVGSRNWIGSMEVSFVLDTLLKVTCRVVNVQVGESLADIAHELASHFKKHGTPVMIGGGVLAHTILGVEINEENDEVRFLVLDPHYTGADQLHQIQNKGWVGWKPSTFWKKDSFYNLCLPYRKIGV